MLWCMPCKYSTTISLGGTCIAWAYTTVHSGHIVIYSTSTKIGAIVSTSVEQSQKTGLMVVICDQFSQSYKPDHVVALLSPLGTVDLNIIPRSLVMLTCPKSTQACDVGHRCLTAWSLLLLVLLFDILCICLGIWAPGWWCMCHGLCACRAYVYCASVCLRLNTLPEGGLVLH